ncbi:MAG: hypothetical protein ACLRXQ_09945 [Phascolarctobacterium faecium]
MVVSYRSTGRECSGRLAWWGAVIDVADNAVISADGKMRGVSTAHKRRDYF